MRFDEKAIKEFKNFESELEVMLFRYDDIESEEYKFLRRLDILLDEAISLSEKKHVGFLINGGELEKFMENAKANGLSPDEVVEDLICKYNKRG
ncbi:MAG: hypothetical protein ACLVME_02505 [Ezakiella coagulans]|uniref:hypothetical protein n=1 Tax=Ezakiella coagulans TaxID=46507 RepID=UPI00399A60C8